MLPFLQVFSELHERLILHRDVKPANVFLKKVRSRPGELGLRALLGGRVYASRIL